MSQRVGLRFFRASRLHFQTLRNSFRQPFQRRHESTAQAAEAAKNEGGFTKLWNSPVGPKTVHFWAPVMKWALVLTGVSDFARPAENLSLTQNIALTATGAIWTRWCLIIKPRNILLAAVNFFLFCVGSVQVSRILLYRQSINNATTGETAKAAAKEEGSIAEAIMKDPHGAANQAVAAK